MLFLRSPYSQWFGLYNSKATKMVDYQMNLEAWLQEASLFRNEPVDNAINFDELFSNEKANTEENQDLLGLSDLGWLDEKVDLAILDNPNSLLDHHYETETLMEDDAAFLLGLMGGTVNASGLSSDALKMAEFNLDDCLNPQNFAEPSSSEILDTHLASPGCTTLQVDSPASFDADSPMSPAYSDITAASAAAPSNYILPDSETLCQSEQHSIQSAEVSVSVYDSPSPSSSSDEALSIEDVSTFVRKRKYVSDGGNIPKVKVVLKEFTKDPQPPAKMIKSSKPKDRRERKKVQNKEAAARYRVKKRIEEKERSDEIANLESIQKKLKDKHDDLKSEIKYLKSLMCEILQKKGIMK